MHSKVLPLLSGPCDIENRQYCLDIAQTMKEIRSSLGVEYFFKTYKANRTFVKSFRGLGLDKTWRSLPMFANRSAFLCSQIDLIRACALSGKPVNLTKGLFEMRVQKWSWLISELRSSLRNFESQNEYGYKPCIKRRFQNAETLQSRNQKNSSWVRQSGTDTNRDCSSFGS